VAAIAKTIPTRQIYRGVLPFLGADMIRLILVFSFPSLALGIVHWQGG
jgi:C4-dicarboxylate transporter, DctM subunit